MIDDGMRLFDGFDRDDPSPKRRREPSFAFLNRTSQTKFEPIRGILEAWFDHFPPDHRPDLRARYRSLDDRAHAGAQFELIMHELLLALGCLVEVHPEPPTGHGRPDFLVEVGDARCYVEVTDVAPKASLYAPDPLEDAVLDAIDGLDSPNFFLWIETEGRLTTAPRHRNILQPIAKLVATNDPDHVQSIIDGGGVHDAPSVSMREGEWELTAWLIPKSPSARQNKTSRAIGAGPGRVGFVDSSGPVRKALTSKANHLGELDHPLVVAVNAPDLDDRIDEMNTLFGSERITVTPGTPNGLPILSRHPDGVWTGSGDDPRYRRLSGALMFRGLAPWSLHSTRTCLYVNPYTSPALPPALLRLPHAVARGGQVEWRDGASVGAILGLPSDYLRP